MLEGFLLSLVVGLVLVGIILPVGTVSTKVERGRQFAALPVFITTMGTLFRYPMPPPKGGNEAIASWIAGSIGIGSLAFLTGVAFQIMAGWVIFAKNNAPQVIKAVKAKSAESARQFNENIQHDRENEERLYDIVAQELKIARINAGLWTKAFAEANGNEQLAKAKYIKLRVDQLKKMAASI